MRDRAKQRRRGNPCAGLLHLLNRRYHEQFVRAELLQNELDGRRNSKFARVADWLRRAFRALVPHPAEAPKVLLAKAEPYRAPRFAVPPNARVSIVIPFRDQPALLANCLRSLRRGTFGNIEVVLVDNGSEDPRTGRVVSRASAAFDLRLVSRTEAFNFSRLCNAGASAATGDHLLFLNNDTEVLSRRWLERMLALAADPNVGAVGATLLYPDRTIQHAGMLPRSDGLWVHPYRGEPANARGANDELHEVRSVPAVTAACLLIRRDLFDSLNGFDESLPLTMNDVDLCRRARERGKLVLVTPRAKLLHYEGLSRGFSVDQSGT